MQDTKNLLYCFLISFVILVGWDYYVAGENQQTIKQASHNSNNGGVKAIEPQNDLEELLDNSSKTVDEVFTKRDESEIVKFYNRNIEGSIWLRGAVIDDLVLNNYKRTLSADSNRVRVLAPKDSKESYIVKFGWMGDSSKIKLPSNDSIWQSNKKSLVSGDSIILSWNNGVGQIFKIEMMLDDNYLFKIKQSVENLSEEIIKVYSYGLINKSVAQDTIKMKNYISHEGLISSANGVLSELTYDDMVEQRRSSAKNINRGWLGISDKYWTSIIAPEYYQGV